MQAQKAGDEYLIFLYDENGSAYGFLLKNGTTEEKYYYLFNAQGDVIGIVDSNGSRVVEYYYDTWGNLTYTYGTLASTIGEKNPLRYRGYYYDVETGFYYLQTRYYDPETGRFINADGVISGTGESVQGYNLFVYCFNNPVNMSDPSGNWPTWNDIKKAAKDAWNNIKTFVSNTFGAGVVQSQSYEGFKLATLIYGNEAGVSTSKTISGDVSKPISVYAENASDWWKITEYKVGIQLNAKNCGFSFATNAMECSAAFSNRNTSFELIIGQNKTGYTYKTGVDFRKRTAEYYEHEYFRTIPTAVAVVGVAASCYYFGTSTITYLISIFGTGAGVSYGS